MIKFWPVLVFFYYSLIFLRWRAERRFIKAIPEYKALTPRSHPTPYLDHALQLAARLDIHLEDFLEKAKDFDLIPHKFIIEIQSEIQVFLRELENLNHDRQDIDLVKLVEEILRIVDEDDRAREQLPALVRVTSDVVLQVLSISSYRGKRRDLIDKLIELRSLLREFEQRLLVSHDPYRR